AKDRSRVTKTQWSWPFRKERRGHARHGARHVRSQCKQTPVVISEAEAALSFTLPHPLFEEVVIIDRRRDHLFIIPSLEDRHRDIFDCAAQSRLGADVVTHSGWNSGGHASANDGRDRS